MKKSERTPFEREKEKKVAELNHLRSFIQQRKEFLNLRAIERYLGVPQKTIENFLSNTHLSHWKHQALMEEFLSRYVGFVAKKLK